MRRLFLLTVAATLALGAAVFAQNPGTEWPAVGNDTGGTKFSPVNQITPANVTQLKEAWSYQPGGPFPIVVNNTMYVISGGNAVALNADTGNEVWKFALREATPGGSVRRGMRKNLTWIGVVSSVRRHFAAAIALLDEGAIRPVDLITHRLPLDAALDGFEAMRQRTALKVMFQVGQA